jgi:orotidine-5'-phosphate decarboxylase
MKNSPQLIVALDLDTLKQAYTLIDKLGDSVDIFKVGNQMFTAYGHTLIRHLHSKRKKVFLDLKFHDIPNTVASAVRSAVCLNVFMLTVHTAGGKEMLEAASQAAREKAKALGVARPKMIGVTVLTSVAKDAGTQDLVLQRARLAKESGLDGVVASVEDTAVIRQELGSHLLIITPGIRSLESSHKLLFDDQKRVGTPAGAAANGSDFLVVGRQIVFSPDPYGTASMISKEMRLGARLAKGGS